MNILPLLNLYEIDFPIYIYTKHKASQLKEIVVKDDIKYLVFDDLLQRAFDVILPMETTYLGRMIYLNKIVKFPIVYDYSFTDIAHLISGLPDFPHKDLIIVDNLGRIRTNAGIRIIQKSRQFLGRKDNYIWVKHYMPAIKIPSFDPLYETLDTYKPVVLLYDYKHTLYFKNILTEPLPQSTRREKLLL